MRALVVILAVAGCSSPTSLFLTVEQASVAPASLRLSLFGQTRIGTPRLFSLSGHALPVSVIVDHLDPNPPGFRVLVDGLDAQGNITSQIGEAIQLKSGQELHQSVQLDDGILPDGDGDGVPDAIDDCPLVPDPNQDCHASGSDLRTPPGDLSSSDLAVVADLKSADLSSSSNDLASIDLKPVVTCPPGALFCDDFESGNTSKWSSTVGGGTVMIGVETTQPLHGTHSLHVQSTSSSDLSWLAHTMTPITSGTVSLRAYIYSAAAFSAPVYFYFLHRDSGQDDYVAGLDTQAGPTQWTLFNKNNGYDQLGTSSFAPGVWHCVEFEVNLAPTNSAKLYVDTDAPLTWSSVPSPMPSVGEMDIGITYQNSGGANSFYIDDVALSTQHIGCE